jgi:hypothetical protein
MGEAIISKKTSARNLAALPLLTEVYKGEIFGFLGQMEPEKQLP